MSYLQIDFLMNYTISTKPFHIQSILDIRGLMPPLWWGLVYQYTTVIVNHNIVAETGKVFVLNPETFTHISHLK